MKVLTDVSPHTRRDICSYYPTRPHTRRAGLKISSDRVKWNVLEEITPTTYLPVIISVLLYFHAQFIELYEFLYI